MRTPGRRRYSAVASSWPGLPSNSFTSLATSSQAGPAMPWTCSLNSPEAVSIVNSSSGTVGVPSIPHAKLHEAAVSHAVDAPAQTFAYRLDHALGIRHAEPGQKLTGEKRSLVVLAHDG